MNTKKAFLEMLKTKGLAKKLDIPKCDISIWRSIAEGKNQNAAAGHLFDHRVSVPDGILAVPRWTTHTAASLGVDCSAPNRLRASHPPEESEDPQLRSGVHSFQRLDGGHLHVSSRPARRASLWRIAGARWSRRVSGCTHLDT